MKKILAIAPYPYLPFFSGGQKFIAKLLEYLGKSTDLTVISTPENDWKLASTYKGLSLLKKSFSRYIDLSLIRKITKEVKENNYDTLIWEHPYYAWLAFRVRRRTGVKTIIHTHNIEYQRFRSTGRWWWPILKVYEKWCFKKADHIFFITPEDRDFAINNWKIQKEKCIDLPFGVDINAYPRDIAEYTARIKAKHQIPSEDKIMFFNGLLDYKPNLDALKAILDEINPILLTKAPFSYKILICGKRLPVEMNELKDYKDKNIIYAGFTEDIGSYYKASDIFLNPVQSGGGIKTKMVEAIAYGNTVVSTQTGAAGMDRTVCGDKLVVVKDNDWRNFAQQVIVNTGRSSVTPQAYYEYYSWENILKRVLDRINVPVAGRENANSI
jgi:glycosyltransferase involved in cell wall biosynthesis